MLLALDGAVFTVDGVCGECQGVPLDQVELSAGRTQISSCGGIQEDEGTYAEEGIILYPGHGVNDVTSLKGRKACAPSRASKLQSLQTSLPCSQKMASFTSSEEVELHEPKVRSTEGQGRGVRNDILSGGDSEGLRTHLWLLLRLSVVFG